MKTVLTKVAVLLMSASLISCSTNTQKENTVVGAGTGAVVGGLIGGLATGGGGVAIGVGVVAGALIGGVIGHSMDSVDKMNMSNSITTGKPATWTNSKSKIVYKVYPSRHMVTVNGNKHCRKYMTKVITNGQVSKYYGVACRNKDGSWTAVQQQ